MFFCNKFPEVFASNFLYVPFSLSYFNSNSIIYILAFGTDSIYVFNLQEILLRTDLQLSLLLDSEATQHVPSMEIATHVGEEALVPIPTDRTNRGGVSILEAHKKSRCSRSRTELTAALTDFVMLMCVLETIQMPTAILRKLTKLLFFTLNTVYLCKLSYTASFVHDGPYSISLRRTVRFRSD